MKNWQFVMIGAVTGFACGAIFGLDYAITGAGLGIAAATTMVVVLKR